MPETDAPPTSRVREVLAGAVEALGGQERAGQIQMAEAVARAMTSGEHLLVQAGTGTGKSLGYLVPALLHDRRVVVATATLALQHQLVERDIPALLEAADHVLHSKPSYAVLKGRSNYACLHRIREGVPDDQGALVEMPTGSMGSEVLALRAWAEEQTQAKGPGDRDSAPKHTDKVWRQVSVNHRECLGAAQVPVLRRVLRRARQGEGRPVPADRHQPLAARHRRHRGRPDDPRVRRRGDRRGPRAVRAGDPGRDRRAVRARGRAHRAPRPAARRGHARPTTSPTPATRCGPRSTSARPGRLDTLPESLSDAVQLVRDAARALISAFPKESQSDGEGDAGRTQARGAVQELFKNSERMAANSEADVLWLAERDRARGGDQLCVAPLQVWGPLRDKLLAEKTVVLTSATLMLGGDFSSVATSLGLKPSERVDHSLAESPEPSAPDDGRQPWRGIDVGSPFDYARQGILYVAKHLPPPGRDGLGAAQIDEIVDLVDAADGRTLGLFSSRRAAEAAAEAARERLPHLTILAQGEAQLPELARLFVEDPHACLFGTLSLWQGLDVPGDTCQLVLIDRIPFPRPDDPLMSARQKAADQAGGNGFMQVAATHAALLLAQGSGRLIRTTTDKGVVAILDPRLVTARYGGFLRASLPPMWSTTDRSVVLSALKRLAS